MEHVISNELEDEIHAEEFVALDEWIIDPNMTKACQTLYERTIFVFWIIIGDFGLCS